MRSPHTNPHTNLGSGKETKRDRNSWAEEPADRTKGQRCTFYRSTIRSCSGRRPRWPRLRTVPSGHDLLLGDRLLPKWTLVIVDGQRLGELNEESIRDRPLPALDLAPSRRRNSQLRGQFSLRHPREYAQVRQHSCTDRHRHQGIQTHSERVRHTGETVDLGGPRPVLPRVNSRCADVSDSVKIPNREGGGATNARKRLSVETVLYTPTHTISPAIACHVDNILARSHCEEY